MAAAVEAASPDEEATTVQLAAGQAATVPDDLRVSDRAEDCPECILAALHTTPSYARCGSSDHRILYGKSIVRVSGLRPLRLNSSLISISMGELEDSSYALVTSNTAPFLMLFVVFPTDGWS